MFGASQHLNRVVIVDIPISEMSHASAREVWPRRKNEAATRAAAPIPPDWTLHLLHSRVPVFSHLDRRPYSSQRRANA
jgi:hypothetical protein